MIAAIVALLLLAALAGVAFAVRATRRARAAEELAETRLALTTAMNADLERAQARIRDLGEQVLHWQRTATKDADEVRRVYGAKVRALEISNEALSAVADLDRAALDACAKLLDGRPGEREWTAARAGLRATGRLVTPQPQTATPPAMPVALCVCGHDRNDHGTVRSVCGKIDYASAKRDGSVNWCPCDTFRPAVGGAEEPRQ